MISQPSTAGGAGASGSPSLRQTMFTYSSQGDLLTRTIQGAEAGSAFTFSTVSTFNAGGQPLTVDPPGYGTADVTSTAYDASRGNGFLVPASRTDPLIGTTSFGHDGFNRQNSVTDVNGVTTATTFDPLNRVTSMTRQGDPAHGVADLVMTYQYDCDDNLVQLWDPNHPSQSQTQTATQIYAFDALNRLLSITQLWAGAGGGTSVTSFAYDVQDHLSQVTDPNGNLTTYTTSDRDLLTRQVSPVTGTTSYAYNEHGQEVTTIDSRNIVTTRTLDPLDRVTAVSYPDSSLNISYGYDTPGSFAKGRLTGITRHGETIGHGYDRFGRLIQDGVLGYAYDSRDNRTSISYPDGAVASYNFDSANREQSLSVQVAPAGSTPAQPVASNATYLPFGPLASVTLGNGLGETRLYDPRYSPSAIQVGPAGQAGGGSPLLSWSFATDPVGNIAAITDQLNAANNRTFAYLDVNYFLTLGNGPWGPRAWTYDKIGNRLSESRGSATDIYSYVTSGSATTAKLAAIALASGGSRTFSYDAAGNTLETVDPTQQLDYLYDAAGSLSSIQSLPDRTTTDLSYDGRRFLRRAQADSAACSPLLTVPTYSSDGLLLERTHRNLLTPAAPALDDDAILYFAGRPIADLRSTSGATTLTYLSTDHLGTPILATTATGAVQWQGGFEPFGTDWNGAQVAGEFVRLPGQLQDQTWIIGQLPSLFYNLNRWYDPGIGRYTEADPLGLPGGVNHYIYSWAHPENWSDSLGLSPRPVKPKDQNNRQCTPREVEECEEICGPRGMESCMVSQTFRLARGTEGKEPWKWREIWKWEDGPMSCSCNEDPMWLAERCMRNLKQNARDFWQWLQDHTPPRPAAPPGLPPFPIPTPPLLPVVP